MTNFLDSILSFFGFSTSTVSIAEQFAYVAALVFLVSAVFLIINFIYKLIYRDNFWTCGTSLLLVIFMVSIAIYWVSLKIPTTVEAFWKVIYPRM